MNRSIYFNFIESQINNLVRSIESRGKLNILDYHIHSESFYSHFLNLLYGWNLRNLNVINQNSAGIDLIDTDNKIVIQVSATATKQKVESALGKNLKKYDGYNFKFLLISKEGTSLRTNVFANSNGLNFSPKDDIIDVESLLKDILNLSIERQKAIFEFVKKELKSDPDPEKLESNLTSIIKILSKEDLGQSATPIEIVPYDIEAKITYNELDKAKGLVEDYKIHYYRLDKIYVDFDKMGVNKSLSVLNAIRLIYMNLTSGISTDEIFQNVISEVANKVRGSLNFESLPEEELSLCATILVVDAFIRCKIFRKPN